MSKSKNTEQLNIGRLVEKEPADKFFSRLVSEYGADIDLQSIIDENRMLNTGIDLQQTQPR